MHNKYFIIYTNNLYEHLIYSHQSLRKNPLQAFHNLCVSVDLPKMR